MISLDDIHMPPLVIVVEDVVCEDVVGVAVGRIVMGVAVGWIVVGVGLATTVVGVAVGATPVGVGCRVVGVAVGSVVFDESASVITSCGAALPSRDDNPTRSVASVAKTKLYVPLPVMTDVTS